MKIDLKVRNQIAQLIVDMSVGESKPVRKQDMVPIIKEVNDVKIIGHALRFVEDNNGNVVAIKKYRLTEIERRFEK